MPSETSDAAVVDLSGPWQIREAIGETWRWHVGSPPAPGLNSVPAEAPSASGWIPASVPGSVVDALHAAGAIPDPRRGWGSRAAEWTGGRSWVHRRVVELSADWAGADAVLEIDGLDPGGRVWWNGEEVGRVDGIYSSLALPVSVVEKGPQLLTIVIDPVPQGVPQVGRTELVTRHAPRLGYGWDFCPPFPHQGIWRPIRLRRGPRMTRVGVVVRCDGVEGGRGTVGVEVDAPTGSVVRVALERPGHEPVRGSAPVVDGRAALQLEVADVELWWPNGHGRQPLGDLTIALGTHIERRRIGFRTLAWEQTPGSPADAAPYGLILNGDPIPLVGVNWAPADAQYGSVSAVRLHHLLDLAQAAGVRLVRVWGGGLAETPEFFDACDERGLLVWQEFSQSSSGMQSAPSANPRFVAAIAKDARELVATRGHHASLVAWGGGNELEDSQGPLSTERSPVLGALAAVVHGEELGRAWFPTSPTGPAFHHRIDVIERAPEDQHDVHGPWEHRGLEGQYRLGNAGTALAHTEFGVEGTANRRLFERLVPEALRWPPDRSNPIYRHLGEWWNNATQVDELFGGGLLGDPAGIDDLRRASQWLQATGLAYSIEADRRRWPRTSMVLPWQLAESYPNAWCTAVVDFAGEPKPAYHAMARAFLDDRATLRTDRVAWAGLGNASAEAWVWSMAGAAPGGRLDLSALTLGGEVLTTTTAALGAVRHPCPVAALSVPTPEGPFLWRARWQDAAGREIDDELVVATGGSTLAGLRALPRTTLALESDGAGARWVVNRGGCAAIGWGVRDERDGADERFVAWGGDPRPLLPGQRRRVRRLTGEPGGSFVLDAFNADAVEIWEPVGGAAGGGAR